jgi:hypothetical protein
LRAQRLGEIFHVAYSSTYGIVVNRS